MATTVQRLSDADIAQKLSALKGWQREGNAMTKEFVLGGTPADKRREGDLATPEGEFYVCYKNPESKYHRFLGLSYPNLEAAECGLRDKLISPEQFIEIRDAIAGKQCPPWKTALGGEV